MCGELPFYVVLFFKPKIGFIHEQDNPYSCAVIFLFMYSN